MTSLSRAFDDPSKSKRASPRRQNIKRNPRSVRRAPNTKPTAPPRHAENSEKKKSMPVLPAWSPSAPPRALPANASISGHVVASGAELTAAEC